MQTHVYRKAARNGVRKEFATEIDTLWLILAAVTFILVATMIFVRDSVLGQTGETPAEMQATIAALRQHEQELKSQQVALQNELRRTTEEARAAQTQLAITEEAKSVAERQNVELGTQVSVLQTQVISFTDQIAGLEGLLEQAGSGKSAREQLGAVEQTLAQTREQKAEVEKTLLQSANLNFDGLEYTGLTVETIIATIAQQAGLNPSAVDESTQAMIQSMAENILAQALADYQNKLKAEEQQKHAENQYQIAKTEIVPNTVLQLTVDEATSSRFRSFDDKRYQALVNQWLAELQSRLGTEAVEPLVAQMLQPDAQALLDKVAEEVLTASALWKDAVDEAAQRTAVEVGQLHILSPDQIKDEIQKRLSEAPNRILLDEDKNTILTNAATSISSVAQAKHKKLVERQENLARLTYWTQLSNQGVQNLDNEGEVAQAIESIIVAETREAVQEESVRAAIQRQAQELVRLYGLQGAGTTLLDQSALINLRIRVTNEWQGARIIVYEGDQALRDFSISDSDPSSILAGEQILEAIADRLLQSLGIAEKVTMNVITEVEGTVQYQTVFSVRGPLLDKLGPEPRIEFHWDDIPLEN